MSLEKLSLSAAAARYLVSTAAVARLATVKEQRPLGEFRAAEIVADEERRLAERVWRELNAKFPSARDAIRAAAPLLRRTRGLRAYHCGDLTAPCAHEAAIKLVLAVNRERFGELGMVLGRKEVRTWPDPDVLLVEIELEYTAALEVLDEVPPPHDATPLATEINQETHAIVLLIRQPTWALARIAEYLGVNRQTLYGWKDFREAATRLGRMKPRGSQQKTSTPRRGHKTSDGQVEAYTDDETE
jgi:hypothetical protein